MKKTREGVVVKTLSTEYMLRIIKNSFGHNPYRYDFMSIGSRLYFHEIDFYDAPMWTFHALRKLVAFFDRCSAYCRNQIDERTITLEGNMYDLKNQKWSKV